MVTGSGKTGTSSFTVNPAALDHFVISAIGSPQTAGTAITGITLTAQDLYSNTITSFTSTVAYSGTAGITGTSAAFTSGQLAGVSVTPTIAGTNMTFMVTGSGRTGTSTFTVNPAALDHFAISSISSPQNAGTPITGITLTAQDLYNNTYTGFTSAVTYSGTAGITGTSAAFTSGQLTGVSVTPTLTGSNRTFVVTGSGKTGTSTFDVSVTMYTWNQTGTNSWATAANWTPNRNVSTTSDILQFNGGGSVTVINVPTQTIGKLVLSNTSTVQLQPASSPAILTVTDGLTTSANDVLDLGTGIILSGTLTVLSNNGTLKTSVPTATSAAPIPAGMTWNGTIEYAAASGAQTIVAGTYNNLTLDNASGTNSATGAITVNGIVTTASGGSGTFDVSGSMTMNNGASLNLAAGPALIFEAGATITTVGTGKIVLASGSRYLNYSNSTPALQVQQTMTGSAGWRMLTAPVSTTVGSLLSGNCVTQGFTGSTYPSWQPNFLWWDETSQGTSLQAWRQPSNSSDLLTMGKGYMYYVFNGAAKPDASGNYSDVLPLTMTTLGTEQPLTTAFDFHVTATTRSTVSQNTTFVDSNAADYGWNLVGNPTPSTINWSAGSGWTKNNIDGTVYIWNPADTVGGYKTWNGTTGNLGSGLIAPFQAFWVKANNSSPVLTCNNNVKSSGAAFLGKVAVDSLTSPPPVLTLTLSANGKQTQAYVMFSRTGKISYDAYDAFSLVPLTDNYLILYTVAGTGQYAMQIQNLPDTNLTDPLTLPLYLGGAVGGQPLSASFTLSWKFDGHLPNGWHLMLMDDAAGNADSMTTVGSKTFQYDTPTDIIPTSSGLLLKSSGTSSDQTSMLLLQRPVAFSVPAAKLSKTNTSASRFRIIVSTNNDLSGYIPTSPELLQNYPNPFNPTTNITFSIPTRSRVTIQVYNILGQKIAILTDQEYTAGNHIVVWNASNIASGVYICRMTAADKTQTKKMVVLR
jgi:hypothetical protein